MSSYRIVPIPIFQQLSYVLVNQVNLSGKLLPVYNATFTFPGNTCAIKNDEVILYPGRYYNVQSDTYHLPDLDNNDEVR